MSNVVMRKASSHDALALAHLAEQTFLDAFEASNEPKNIRAYVKSAFSHVQVSRELSDDASTFFVAERDSALVAYAKVRVATAPACVGSQPATELHRIYVEQRFFGTGIGQMLLDASIGAAREAGHAVLWLGVWEHNPDAVAFYEKFGFETVGSQKFMMGPQEQTDFIMRLELSPAAD
ncbi:MAG: N-acetyltransferase family protein [Gammaproteobacteria bacterium]